MSRRPPRDETRARDEKHDHRAPRRDRSRSRSRSPTRTDHRREDRRRDRSPLDRHPPSRRDKRRDDRDDRNAPPSDPARRREDRASSRSPPPQNRRVGEAQQSFPSSRAPPRGPRASRLGPGPGPGMSESSGERRNYVGRSTENGSTNIDPPDPDEDEETAMQRLMGFGAFRSTKETKVPGNDKNYAVHKVKKTEYRQYMNRVGGFNRALSPSR